MECGMWSIVLQFLWWMLLHFSTLCLNTAQKKIKHSENIFQSKFRNWSKLVKNRDFLKKVNRRYLKDGKKVSNLKLSHFSKLSYYWGWWNIPLITINHNTDISHFAARSFCFWRIFMIWARIDQRTAVGI